MGVEVVKDYKTVKLVCGKKKLFVKPINLCSQNIYYMLTGTNELFLKPRSLKYVFTSLFV